MDLKEAINHIEHIEHMRSHELIETTKDTEAFDLILAAARTQLTKTKKQYGVTTRHSDDRGTRTTMFDGQPRDGEARWCPYEDKKLRDAFARRFVGDKNFIGLDLTEMDVPA